MTAINDGGPAFPNVPNGAGERWANWDTGMTLRDYFATKALATAIGYASQDLSSWAPEDFAKHAYQIADAMLAARGAQ